METAAQAKVLFAQTQLCKFSGEVTGVITAAEPDADGEILDYFASKPYFQQWSESQNKASGGKSYGNVRLQHDGKKVAGLLTAPLEFDDNKKLIRVKARIVDENAKNLLEAGALTGFSIGGDYVSRKPLPNGLISYVANPSEVSVCDRPCAPSAVFESIKSDGTMVLTKFQRVWNRDETEERIVSLHKAGFSQQLISIWTGVFPGSIYLTLQKAGVLKARSTEMLERRRRMVETNIF